MKTYLERCFILLTVFLFVFLGLLMLMSHQKSPAVSYATYSTVSLESDNNQYETGEKIKLDSYQSDSPDSIGVLITANDIDSANSIVKLKGGTSKKHKIGHVIAANVPQNQLNSLSQDSSINQILPNRPVQAFSIDVSETNAVKFWNLGITGKDVKVAVLDTGVFSNNVVASQDFTGEGINDDNGHGTKIAEIILAMAPDAKIINAKVLDKNGFGSEASVIAGINYAVEQNADIISLSLGGLFNDLNSPLVAAVEDAISKGATVVAASGNCGKPDLCGNFVGVATPGNAPNAITVGSVDGENPIDYSAGFNFGNYIKPDVTAPVSANSLSGTSASTPFVSGAAALIIEKYKAKPVEVKSLLEKNAKDLGINGKDTVFGSGKLNLDFLNEEILKEGEELIVFEPEQAREINDEMNIRAFESKTSIITNQHPVWNVLNIWPVGMGNSHEGKYAIDALDDNFIIVAGNGYKRNVSSILIWNGTNWLGNNKTGITDSMYDIDIYDRNFAVIGGTNHSLDYHPVVYIWDGTNFIRTQLSNPTITFDSKMINVFVKSPSEAYALETNGRISKYDGVSWKNNLTQKIGTMDFDLNERSITSDILDENHIMIAYGRDGPFFKSNAIYFFNGVSWINTSFPVRTDCNTTRKVKLFSSGNAYALCIKTLWKWNGATWSLAYNSTVKLNDFSFIDESFGFLAADNGTMLKWTGSIWTEKKYIGYNITYPPFTDYSKFDFYKVYARSRTEAYAVGLYYGGSESVINSNWRWDGSEWTKYTVNVTKPNPAGTATGLYLPGTLRLSPWYFVEGENKELYALGYDDLNSGFAPPWIGRDSGARLGWIGMNSILMKLKAPISFNVPGQNIAKNGNKEINLTDFTSNKTATYSVLSQNPSEAACSISKTTNLIITGASNFEGITSCLVQASTSEATASSDVLIYVGTVPTTLDVYVDSNDISFNPVTNNPVITIHSVAGGINTNVDISLMKVANNKIINEQTFSYSLDTSQETNTFNPSFTMNRGEELFVVVDSNNVLSETNKGNNKARNTYKKSDVYLNLNIENQFEQPIIDYLKGELTNYNVVSDSNAEYRINISYSAGSKQIGCDKGNVYNNGQIETQPHTGAMFTTTSGGKTSVNVCGARIEGLVNAIRMMNKDELNSNKDFVFTKSNPAAIGTLDFMRLQGTINADIVSKALYGGVTTNEKIVRTSAPNSVWLRLKEYKPIVSQSFLDYLYNINHIDTGWMPPVILARGLWSTIEDWDELGKEISIGMEDGMFRDSIKYLPRDVWLIELTGGPGTECDSCPDYTYDDVVDKYWPALVGGAIKLAKQSNPESPNYAVYVGFSNGARSGLDAIKNWGGGKTPAGTLSDGTSFDLPTNSIDTYIGVGIPGAFNGNSIFLESIRARLSRINNELTNQNLHHITILDLIIRGVFRIERKSNEDSIKISFNLWKKYAEFMNSTTDSQPGIGVNLDKSLFIAGTLFGTHDEIVPVNDVDTIYSNINVNFGSQNKKVLMHMPFGHAGMADKKTVKTTIKQFLNDDPLTGKIENQVNG